MASYLFDPTHTLVRQSGQVFLVLFQGTYAARAWPAHPSPSSELGPASPASWVFATSDLWTWLIVTDATEWHFIATEWVKNEHEPHLYGFVAAQEVHPGLPHVPVVAEALVQTSHREIVKTFRKDLCSLVLAARHDEAQVRLLPASGQPEHRQHELQAMHRLLQDHALCPKYMDRLAQLHKKQIAKAKKQVARKKPKNVDSDASESPASASSVEDAKGSALTFACLDTLDDKNRQEWAKDAKTNALTGLAGVKRMARQMIRRNRQAFRNKSATSVVVTSPSVKCSLPWMRPLVPGTKESGVALPEGTLQSCLENPPGRFVWVARFRHPKLSEMHKRPTRSKSYRGKAAGSVTEHRSFQIALSWLWQRYTMICVPASGTCMPAWVEDALQDCSSCNDNKDDCSCMSEMQSNWMEQHQCTNPPQSDSSGAGSIWSGDGTSATESSCNEQATILRAQPAGYRPRGSTAGNHVVGSTQERQHGTPLRTAVAEEASTKLRLLLVGDSNASGYCETQPHAKSLRCHLSARLLLSRPYRQLPCIAYKTKPKT